ncbi:hypothetical protein [Zobellia uliginosa]|nr:hypothetical protein [Zobellia uliginosa]MBU2948044.1 hypothetical protein [Zobellia uliginosa]
MEKDTPEVVDNSFPEEWIISTVTARGKNRLNDEGLSQVEKPEGLIL